MYFGMNQVPRRNFGFKADYFSVMANALTTECVFLDGAAHQVSCELISKNKTIKYSEILYIKG